MMSLLYIYILWVTACVDCNVSPTDAAESLVTVSAPVGSTVILPCKLTEVFTKTSVILWKINRKDVVFERSSNGASSGSGYEGRVDIPVDELLKGNCSLVLKNVRITDDHLYKTFTMEHVDSTNSTEVKEINRVNLSVYDQISARVGSTAVLPCEWRDLSIQTPHVQWVIDSEIVFERKGKELFPGEGYEGRVDVPEDELLKGNCSLVLKNVTVTDAGIYRSFMLVKDTQEPVLVQKIKLSVDEKPEESKESTRSVHNIIQRFRESGTISVRKGQGRKNILDARDLRALRRHCITYRNATVMEITTWAQEYFQKTLSVNTIHRAIRRRRLKLYRSKKKPYLNMIQKRRRFLWAKAHLKWTVAKWKTVLWSESKFEVLFGKLGHHVIRTKEDKDNPSCYQRSVQKPASLMVWGCMSACGMGSLHIWKGTINAERLLLHAYERVPEAYRQSFRNSVKADSQTYVEFAREKSTLFEKCALLNSL
ncbi:hypothetical protein QTP70_031876 [Hemibagrus guttatus]|uniref:Immunoglobulin domain-containing protein n=1 Tax=Hemibagrus guttatus TaxID=175788 RepID=A0AAE0UYF6_9TELE|nr:hypothetical protein QTP70_031876 [Hemibagrus guttatus]